MTRVRDGRLRTWATAAAAAPRTPDVSASGVSRRVVPLSSTEVGLEGRFIVGQAAVLAVDLPRAHAGQACTRQRHAAVAVAGRVQVGEAFIADLVAVG